MEEENAYINELLNDLSTLFDWGAEDEDTGYDTFCSGLSEWRRENLRNACQITLTPDTTVPDLTETDQVSTHDSFTACLSLPDPTPSHNSFPDPTSSENTLSDPSPCDTSSPDPTDSNRPVDEDVIKEKLECIEQLDRTKAELTMLKLNFDSIQGLASLVPVKKKAETIDVERKYIKGPQRKVRDVLGELREFNLREGSLQTMSSYVVVQLLEDDVDRYKLLGSYLFQSAGILEILLQELQELQPQFSSKVMTLKMSCKVMSVLYLLQSMAANREAWGTLVKALTPNCLTTLILTNFTEIDHYETVRMVSLSVIGLICQNLEEETARWAIENDVILICQHAMRAGSSYSKLMAVMILESILESEKGIILFCDPDYTDLETVIGFFAKLLVAAPRSLEPFLQCILSLILSCCLLLTGDQRACKLLLPLRNGLPQDDIFIERLKEFPGLEKKWEQLLSTLDEKRLALPTIGTKQT